jgi:hypothetical protein
MLGNYLPHPLYTRFVRVCPLAYRGAIALRFELYGWSHTQRQSEDDEAAFDDAHGSADSTSTDGDNVQESTHITRNPAYREEAMCSLVPLRTPSAREGGELADLVEASFASFK